ncbi:MAG: hypothetical protein FLDDKLPJ_00631 [Phycisphaerae bacterium]|nr:hypothetical protein [Phycisphaerae bacterium]
MWKGVIAGSLIFAVLVCGCERKPKSGTSPEGTNANTAPEPVGNSNVSDKPPAPPQEKNPEEVPEVPGHGGPVVELGEQDINGLMIRASRDAGELKPGGEAAVDVWIDGGIGSAVAVRFWIGVADGAGSVKAKAGVEGEHWHHHLEIPDPMPEDAQLWVEIELEEVEPILVAFDLTDQG